MSELGDYAEDYATLNTKFTTVQATGAPTVLAGSPVVKVYKANGTGDESTAGITLTADFDSVVGLSKRASDATGIEIGQFFFAEVKNVDHIKLINKSDEDVVVRIFLICSPAS